MQQITIGDRILEVVSANPGCTLDEVSQQLPDLQWNDLFLEMHTLRRLGQLQLNRITLGWKTTSCLPQ
jgi:hypothetical protein